MALLAIISILLIVVLLGSGYLYSRISYKLPSIDELPVLLDKNNGELLQPTRILDRTGQVTLFTYQDPGIERKILSVNPDSPDHVSPQMIRTITSALDPSFWQSPGYDLKQWRNPQPQTIAERLVDELLLWGEPETTNRTIRMRLLAGQIVAQYGRTQVLEWYLNSAWFGNYAFGVESAAQLYLQKSAQDLSLAEAALLTPLIESPALNPINAPGTALQMQRDFLKTMLKQGQINQKEYDLAIVEKLKLRKTIASPGTIAAGFIRQVEKQLANTFGDLRIQRGGLVVVTTLDADLQNQFLCTTTTQLIRIQSNNISGVAPGELDCPAALLLPTQSFANENIEFLSSGGIIMDPQNGEVLAYLEPMTVSGERLADSGYQPGSLLTPVAALAAFARGYSPASLMWDVPPPTTAESGTQNQGAYHGAVNIRSALANDYLNPISSLVEQIGAGSVWKLGAALGLSSLNNLETGISPLFKGADTDFLQLGTAYSTLANSGVRVGKRAEDTSVIIPKTIQKVTSTTGRVLLEEKPAERSAVLSEALAYLVNNVLSDETARWPSLGYPNVLEISSPVAVKVGSAVSGHQVWTAGYTPQRLVITWMGDGKEGQDLSELDERMAAGIWHALIRYSTRDISFNGWEVPLGVTAMDVCSPSGMLPTQDCPNVMKDVFLMGNEPTIPDTLYIKIKINRETGQKATVFTPPDMVEERIFMNVPPEVREWALQSGIQLAPQGYDSILQTQPDPGTTITKPDLFSAVSGKVNIIGTASQSDFSSYSVQVGEGIFPENWLQVASSTTKPVQNGLLAEWDTTGLDGLYAIRLTLVDSQNRIKSAVTQVTVDNTPPSARITYPQDGQTVEPVRGGVTLTALVDDLVGIEKVEWWLDGRLVSTQSTAPYVYLLANPSKNYEVQLKVWDLAGNQTLSAKISFTIQP